jgi:hypothetical protein
MKNGPLRLGAGRAIAAHALVYPVAPSERAVLSRMSGRTAHIMNVLLCIPPYSSTGDVEPRPGRSGQSGWQSWVPLSRTTPLISVKVHS